MNDECDQCGQMPEWTVAGSESDAHPELARDESLDDLVYVGIGRAKASHTGYRCATCGQTWALVRDRTESPSRFWQRVKPKRGR